MKRSFIITSFLLVVAFSGFGQQTRWGTESLVNSGESHRIRYTREFKTDKDDNGGKIYQTIYSLFNDDGEQFMCLLVEHYKSKGRVDIVFIPYRGGLRDDNNVDGFSISKKDFSSQCYINKGIYYMMGSKFVETFLCFLSSNKEHLKLVQIIDMDPTDKIHYKLDN